MSMCPLELCILVGVGALAYGVVEGIVAGLSISVAFEITDCTSAFIIIAIFAMIICAAARFVDATVAVFTAAGLRISCALVDVIPMAR